MTSDRTILITGVTGNQDGAVARTPQGTGFHLRGLRRKPKSQRAAMARHGIDVVKGTCQYQEYVIYPALGNRYCDVVCDVDCRTLPTGQKKVRRHRCERQRRVSC